MCYSDGVIYGTCIICYVLVDAIEAVERWFAVYFGLIMFACTLFTVFDRSIMMTGRYSIFCACRLHIPSQLTLSPKPL